MVNDEFGETNVADLLTRLERLRDGSDRLSDI
jgi:hypothetical protein